MNETKENILKKALQLTSLFGLESLSIGKLAKEMEMSKSGLFAHFKSKENLQIEVLRYGSQLFTESIFKPALAAPRGTPRIRALVENWPNWIGHGVAGDCPILAALTELDEKMGPVREFLFEIMTQYMESLSKMSNIAKEEGHFPANTDSQQFAFELISIMLGYQATRKLPWQAEQRLTESMENLIQRFEEGRKND